MLSLLKGDCEEFVCRAGCWQSVVLPYSGVIAIKTLDPWSRRFSLHPGLQLFEIVMAISWYSFVNGLRERTGALWRRWEHCALANRTLLVVTKNARCKTSLRTLALEQGWRILFAETIEDGLRLQNLDRICLLIYDHQLPGVDWRDGLRTLLALDEPTLPIVIANVVSARLRSEVLNCGGFDLARNPLEQECFVNGALALAESIDSIESDGVLQLSCVDLPIENGGIRLRSFRPERSKSSRSGFAPNKPRALSQRMQRHRISGMTWNDAATPLSARRRLSPARALHYCGAIVRNALGWVSKSPESPTTSTSWPRVTVVGTTTLN